MCTTGCDELAGNKLCLPRTSTIVFCVHLVYLKPVQSTSEHHCIVASLWMSADCLFGGEQQTLYFKTGSVWKSVYNPHPPRKQTTIKTKKTVSAKLHFKQGWTCKSTETSQAGIKACMKNTLPWNNGRKERQEITPHICCVCTRCKVVILSFSSTIFQSRVFLGQSSYVFSPLPCFRTFSRSKFLVKQSLGCKHLIQTVGNHFYSKNTNICQPCTIVIIRNSKSSSYQYHQVQKPITCRNPLRLLFL